MDLNFSIHSGSDPEVHKKITWKGRLGQFKPAVFFFFKLVFFPLSFVNHAQHAHFMEPVCKRVVYTYVTRFSCKHISLLQCSLLALFLVH